MVSQIIADFPIVLAVISFSTDEVEPENWNAEYEKEVFEPIRVGDRCIIYDASSPDASSLMLQAPISIAIDQTMAFGNGAHETTKMIVSELLSLDLSGLRVLDCGCGTGILAILAAMRGAGPVTAIEIDAFAYDNAVENCRLNHHAEIRLIHGDATALDAADIAPADIFIANINRNVITADIARYAAKLVSGGTMLLSGFYEADVPIITAAAEPLGLAPADIMVKDNWTCLKLIKQ